jgi:3'5'-cyclic nucleotide phosphodiesterase
MKPHYVNLRSCICISDEEFVRFRSLVVNSVMATDVLDKESGAARKARWAKAFDKDGTSDEDEQVAINRKATIVIEHLIQASDVSHTMQHWHVYVKWNEASFISVGALLLFPLFVLRTHIQLCGSSPGTEAL